MAFLIYKHPKLLLSKTLNLTTFFTQSRGLGQLEVYNVTFLLIWSLDDIFSKPWLNKSTSVTVLVEPSRDFLQKVCLDSVWYM